MRTGLEQKKNISFSAGRPMMMLLFLMAAVLLFSFCIDGFVIKIHSPWHVLVSIGTWFRLAFAKLLHMPTAMHITSIVSAMPYYGGILQRIKLTAMTFGCGALMALSGSIFQMVFRNPMAAPTMLGVSSGVNLGVAVLVMQYEYAAATMIVEKYIYCYIGAVMMLTLVLAMGKLSSGKGRMNSFDLLIVGAIVSQVAGAVVVYFTYSMDNDVALVYQQLLGAIEMDVSGASFVFLGAALLISIVSMVMMRFSFNAAAFEPDDSRSLGVNVYAVKIVTMILGTLMMTAAMIHCGTAGMISLIAPFFARGLFGPEFRRQLAGDLFIGGTVLVLCKDIVGLIPFYGSSVPLGTIVDFVVLPIFVVMVAAQRRVWA